MLSADNNWTFTIVLAALATAFAAVGLGLANFYPGAAPFAGASLLATSLGCTVGAFSRVALRVRRLELENEGLIEEVSQEFDRVKDKLEIFNDALAEPHRITPQDAENVPLRRITLK